MSCAFARGIAIFFTKDEKTVPPCFSASSTVKLSLTDAVCSFVHVAPPWRVMAVIVIIVVVISTKTRTKAYRRGLASFRLPHAHRNYLRNLAVPKYMSIHLSAFTSLPHSTHSINSPLKTC
jgi:hypothetical protein